MNIALCDDEKIFIDNLKSLLDKFSFQYNIDLYIDTFPSGEDFLNAINNSDKKYDLIFLDILMKDLNGIETAKKIREIDSDVGIVFLTSTIEFALNGYDVKALNYLMKPISYDKLKKILLDLNAINNYKDTLFTYTVNNTLYSIPLNDITYFEVQGRVISIHTINNKYMENNKFYKKFDDLEKELKSYNFIKTHRSYLVNLKNIFHISNQEISFVDTSIAPVSRRLYKTTKDIYLDYIALLV